MSQAKPKYLCPNCGQKAVVFTSKGAFWCIPTKKDGSQWGCGANFQATDTRLTSQQGGNRGAYMPPAAPNPPQANYPPNPSNSQPRQGNAANQPTFPGIADAPTAPQTDIVQMLTIDALAEAVAKKVLDKLLPVFEKGLLPPSGTTAPAKQESKSNLPVNGALNERQERLTKLIEHRLFTYVENTAQLTDNLAEVIYNEPVLEKWISYLEGKYKDVSTWQAYVEDLKKDLDTFIGGEILSKKIIAAPGNDSLKSLSRIVAVADALEYAKEYCTKTATASKEQIEKVVQENGMFSIFDLPWADIKALKAKGNKIIDELNQHKEK